MRRKSAFTLVEMLVVIGIIVLLVGIAAPMVYKAYKSGSVARLKADMAAISTALEAYKNDFGDYPRASVSDGGAAILGKALVGPGDRIQIQGTTVRNAPADYNASTNYKPGDLVKNGAISPGPPNPDYDSNLFVCLRECTGKTPPTAPTKYNDYWTNLSPFDGADGAGFRVRPEINGVAQGKSTGPYLNAGRVAMRGMAFTDANGNPILYFAGSSSKGNLSVPDNGTTVNGGYLTVFKAANDYSDPRVGKMSRFNLRDNIAVFRRDADSDYANATRRIAGLLGDYGSATATDGDTLAPDGAINNGTIQEKAVDASYLLWCAGSDGQFGPETVSGSIYDFRTKELPKCDDVTNFR